jgi:hypothetical protein
MKNQLSNDIWLYYIVLAVLGLIGIASVIGAVASTFGGQSTPEVIVAFGATAIVGFVSLLASLNR